MRTLLKTILFLVLFFVVGVLCYSVFYLAYFPISGLDKDVSKAILAIVGTVLVSVLTIVGSKFYETRQQIQVELREKKTKIYERMLRVYHKYQFESAEEGVQAKDSKDLASFHREGIASLMLWASDDVITTFAKMRNHKEGENVLALYENVILAMRKDLGNKNKQIREGDVLSLFITKYKEQMGLK